MMLRYALILLLTLCVAATSPAEVVLEDRIPIRHITPTQMVDRVQVLAGFPEVAARRIQLEADDANKNVIARIPASMGDPLERERLRLLLREYISKLDQPDRKVLVHLYMVHNSLLTEEEFLLLDKELRRSPVKFEPGTTKKGVVFHNSGEYPALEIVPVDKTQAERFATSQPDPVSVKGRMLPTIREDGRASMTFELTASTTGPTGFLDGSREIRFGESAAPGEAKPLIVFIGGQRIPMENTRKEPHPGRYELMVYLWLAPVKDAKKLGGS